MRVPPISKTIMSTTIAAVALLLAAAPASALTVPGWSGAPDTPGSTCFIETDGGAKNNCGSVQAFDITVALNQGPHTITLDMFSNDDECYFYGVSPYGNGFNVLLNAGNFGGWYNVDYSVDMPANDALAIICYMNPGSVLYGVNYNQ